LLDRGVKSCMSFFSVYKYQSVKAVDILQV
jgi:hypothetical protein